MLRWPNESFLAYLAWEFHRSGSWLHSMFYRRIAGIDPPVYEARLLYQAWLEYRRAVPFGKTCGFCRKRIWLGDYSEHYGIHESCGRRAYGRAY